jgi:hypothetical protein
MPTTTSGNLTTTVSNRQLSDGGPTIIGLSAADTLSFFGSTPSAQPTAPTVHNVLGGAAGGTTGLFRDTTFTGGVGTTAYTVGDLVMALKALGLVA